MAKENTRLKLALAIPTAAPVILGKERADISPLVADKIIRVLSN